MGSTIGEIQISEGIRLVGFKIPLFVPRRVPKKNRGKYGKKYTTGNNLPSNSGSSDLTAGDVTILLKCDLDGAYILLTCV